MSKRSEDPGFQSDSLGDEYFWTKSPELLGGAQGLQISGAKAAEPMAAHDPVTSGAASIVSVGDGTSAAPAAAVGSLVINLVYDTAAQAAPQSFRDGMQAAANMLMAAFN